VSSRELIASSGQTSIGRVLRNNSGRLDALAAGKHEVMADEGTRVLKQSLSSETAGYLGA
jgi:hypothetical protein